MEELNNVQTKQVDCKCDKCKVGYMRPNGIVYMTNPPQYEHICTSCGYKQSYGVRYPYVTVC